MENIIVGAVGVIVCLAIMGALFGVAGVLLGAVAVFSGFMFILGLTTRMDQQFPTEEQA